MKTRIENHLRKDIYRFLSVIILLVGSVVFSHGQELTKAESDARNLVVTALILYESKQYNQSIETATNAAKLLPKDHRPWAIIGNCYFAQWKMKSASEAYAKAAEINPRHKALWYMKASADRNRNAREESIAAAKKAIEIDAKYAEAYEVMGESLAMGSKDNKGALEALKTAVKLKPDFAKASEHLGMQLLVAGNKKEAEEVYRKAMDLDPKKMACRFNLGRILVEQGRLAEAREIWNGRSWDEKNTIPVFIDVLERAERKKAAEAKLAASPNDPNALMELGFAWMEGDSWSADDRQRKAIEFFRKALAISSELVRAQYGICKAYVELANFDTKLTSDLDKEIAKLKGMDTKLADEIIVYRKNYSGGFKIASDNPIDK